MSYKHIPELAEMLTPPDDRFEMLRQGFESMAKDRDSIARFWYRKGSTHMAYALFREKHAFQQCADELTRVLAGETPPAPGEAWETKQEKPE